METRTPELLKTLSNKTNLEIINLLKNEPSYPRRISEILGMQEAYISRILTQLEKLGILKSQWVYRERNIKLYSVDTDEINIAFEPDGLKIHLKARGEKELVVSYDAFTFDIPPVHEFIGRSKELSQCEKASFGVIEGIPGVGKTYLAAFFVKKEQSDGKKVFWHNFTEIDSFHYIVNKISVFLNNFGYSNLLEYVKQGGRDERVCVSLIQHGVTGDMILCFDGFQHVRDERIVTLFKLLRALKGKVIITSRERPPFLRLFREDISEIRLSPFTQPETLEFLSSRGTHIDSIVFKEIYTKVGGHPLILNMFCEATRDKPASDLLYSLPEERVDDYLWSEIFGELNDEARELVEWLSVFRVPASSHILRQLYGRDKFWKAMKNLERKMLVKKQDGHYMLPSMIREFTYGNIIEKKELHEALALHYLKEKNAEGFLEAMYHFIKAGEQEKAAALIMRPPDVDLIEQGFSSPYMKILDMVEREKVPPQTWCATVYDRGRIFLLRGDTRQAFTAFSDMKETAERINSKKDFARALYQLGNVHAYQGEWELAHARFGESLSLLEESSDLSLQVHIHADTGLLLMKQHRFAEALTHLEKGKKIAEQEGYTYGACRILRRIANIYYYQDNFDSALAYYEKSLSLAEASLDVREIAANYNDMGLVYFYKGDFEKALQYYEKDREISERTSDSKAKISSYGNLGMVYTELEDYERAEYYYAGALTMAEELEDPYYITYLKMKLAHLHLMKGNVAKSCGLCEDCLGIFDQLGESLHYGEFCRVYGSVLHSMGEWERARSLYEESLEKLRESPLEQGKTHVEYAIALRMEGEKGSDSHYRQALSLFESTHAEREYEKAKLRWNSIFDHSGDS
ncbi:MAG: tetratricopeptide repeat protein [Theionarchaea archaeon]|nr:tetratricopeptide repeat protein [Theionarchaea archaeon]